MFARVFKSSSKRSGRDVDAETLSKARKMLVTSKNLS